MLRRSAGTPSRIVAFVVFEHPAALRALVTDFRAHLDAIDHCRDVVLIRVASALAKAVDDCLQAHAVAPLASLDASLHIAQ
jgi:hypothetical protein